MTVALKSLRITADMDITPYARALAQKAVADQQAIEGSELFAQALARQDAAAVKAAASLNPVDIAAAKAARSAALLSRSFVDSYSAAARFEKAVHDVGNALSNGSVTTDRAAVVLDGIYKKFRLVADATSLAGAGGTMLAPIVSALNNEYAQQAASLDKAAAAANRYAVAQQQISFKRDLNARLGVSNTSATDRGASYTQFENLLRQQEAEQSRQRHQSQTEINRLMGITVQRAADSGGGYSALDQMMQDVQRQRAERARAEAAKVRQTVNATTGVSSGSALDSGAGFSALESRAAKEMGDMADQATRLRGEINPLGAAQAAYNAQLARHAELARAGAISTQEMNAANALAKTRLDNIGSAFRSSAGHQSRFTRDTGLSSYAVTNLGFQVNDVITTLAMGMSPMQVLTQQGGQIYQVFQMSSKSVGATATGLMRAFGSLLTPITVATGAMATFGITAAMAYRSYLTGQMESSRSLSGTGRGSGLSLSGLNDIVDAGAGSANVSTSSSREMANAFASTGRIGAGMFGDLIKFTKDYAATTRQSTGEASQELAKAFADPARGAEVLQEKLGALDARTLRTIQSMQAMGDRSGAGRVLLDAVAGSTMKAAEATTALGRAWDATTRQASNFFESLGKGASYLLDGPDVSQQMAAAQAALAATEQRQKDSMFSFVMPGEYKERIEDQKAYIAGLQRQIDYQKEVAAGDKKAADGNRDSQLLQTLIDEANPAEAAARKVEERIVAIQKALQGEGRFKIDVTQAQNALAGLGAQLGTLNRALQYGGVANMDRVDASAHGANNAWMSSYGRSASDAARERDLALRDAAGDAGKTKTANDIYQNKISELQATHASQPSSYRTSINQVPSQYQSKLYEAANKYGVDPNLAASVMRVESNYNPNARSSAGAVGLMQLMPGTARDMGVTDRSDPNQSIEGGVKYLSQMLARRNGDVSLALMDYNWGMGNVDKWKKGGSDPAAMKDETRNYLTKIQGSTPDTQAQVTMMKDWQTQGQEQIKTLENITANYGKSTYEMDKNTFAQQRLAELTQKGVPVTGAMTAEIEKQAAAYANLNQRKSAAIAMGDAQFERDQLGRSSQEQQTASKLRSAGIDAGSDYGKELSATWEVNDALKTTKDLSQEAFSGIVSDLRNGKTAAEAFTGALNKIADKLVSMAMDQALSGMFKGMFSGLGSMFGGIGATSGGASVSAIPGFGNSFAKGGVMSSRGSIPLRAYARGGVATSPQLALFGEGSHNEAYVPLPDGRSIPVTMRAPAPVVVPVPVQTGGRGGGVTSLTINEASGQTAQVSQDEEGNLTIDMVADQLEARMAGNASRGRGPMGRMIGGVPRSMMRG